MGSKAAFLLQTEESHAFPGYCATSVSQTNFLMPQLKSSVCLLLSEERKYQAEAEDELYPVS